MGLFRPKDWEIGLQKARDWGIRHPETKLYEFWYKQFIAPIEEGRADPELIAQFLFDVTNPSMGHAPSIATKNDLLSPLVLQVLEWMCHRTGPAGSMRIHDRAFDFAIKWEMRDVDYQVRDLQEGPKNGHDSKTWCLVLIAQLDNSARKKAEELILQAARDSTATEPTPPFIVVCLSYGWNVELEKAWREHEDTYKLLLLLLVQRRFQEALDWAKAHNLHAECVFLSRKQKRYSEAADFLAKVELDDVLWETRYAISKEELLLDLNRKAALVTRPVSPPTIDIDAVTDRYAYGEISKTEYEKLKAQASGPTAKTCASCGHAVEPANKFCPHCGAKTSTE
jgi:rubrerythrin